MTARASMVVLVAVAAVAAGGCKKASSAAQPATFERAGDVAFACFDRTTEQPVPFDSSSCDVTQPKLFMMLALVTQTSTGEVASVDLNETDDPNAGKVFDLDPRIPGYTFYKVMPSPVAIVVPTTTAPKYAYVASFSGRAVQAIPLVDLLPPKLRDAGVPMPDGGTTPDAGTVVSQPPVTLGGSPTDMVLGPDDKALYVAVPQIAACAAAAGMDGGTTDGGTTSSCGGQVYRIPLNDGVMGTPQALLQTDPGDPLPSTIPTSVPATLPPSAQPDAYQLICAPPGVTPPLSVPTPPIELHSLTGYQASDARPVSLAVDGVSGGEHLLVADEGLPIIHRINLTNFGEDDALAVGVPTRRLAVTPEVQPTLADMTPSARYVYAIDATDQSILTVDYTSGASTFGAVLPVSPGSSTPYRLPFYADGAALAVAQPELPVAPGTSKGSCNYTGSETETAGPTQLNGVFLTTALTDGSLHVVDVQDDDVGCRGYNAGYDPMDPGTCTMAGTGNVSAQDEQVYIRRNRPRIGVFVNQSDEFVTLSGSPLFRIDNTLTRVLDDGTTESGEGPGLTPFTPCPNGMAQVFPTVATGNTSANMPLICVLADPWMARSQNWYATWQGTIPGSAGGGRLWFDASSASWKLDVPGGALCDAGVLGKDGVPSATTGDPLSQYKGDALVITSDLLSTKQNDPVCQTIAGDSSNPKEVSFKILAANQTQLTLGSSASTDNPDAKISDIIPCYGDHISFTVRTENAYTVHGSYSGFLNPVATRANGDCYVPPNADLGDRGRAFEGNLFTNRQVAFEIPSYSTAGTDVQLSFTVIGGLIPLQVSLGQASSTVLLPVVPTALRYNRLNKYLYVVDSANQGLIEFKLQPFSLNRSFE